MSSPNTKMRASGLRLALSYALDWIVIIVLAIIAGAITKAEPNHRPFSLVDPSISFPYVEKPKISTPVLFVLSLVVPALIILVISLALAPRSVAQKYSSKSGIWKRRLWEWNVGWMGLALGCAITALFTNALKLLIGKPRPDLISRCQPKLSEVGSYTLGGISDQVSEGVLVSWTICQQADPGILKDGFQSCPSGHASFAFAGFFYLALYLCSKFAVKLPFLPYFSIDNPTSPPGFSRPEPGNSGYSESSGKSSGTLSGREDNAILPRHEAAAPPLYLLVLPLISICIATYIASTRYSDFRHQGFDILFGASLGILFSWLSFRLYHLPIARGDGLAWSSRSASRAFGIAIGNSAYVEKEEYLHSKKSDDIEAGQTNGNPGEHLPTSGDERGKRTQQGM